jgi:hypothetical protein
LSQFGKEKSMIRTLFGLRAIIDQLKLITKNENVFSVLGFSVGRQARL